MLKLFHGTTLIGIIKNEMPDDLAMVGDIELTAAAEDYKEVFEFFADEEKGSTVEPPFENEIIENWNLEDSDGKREDIFMPTIYPDGLICWR